MKLKLIVDYDVDSDDLTYADEGDSLTASSHRNYTTLPHENRTFNSVLIYNVLSGLTRSSYDIEELPLVDVPDDLLFQFMVMGINDGDYIAYNYATHRLVLANKHRLASRYAAREDDNDEPHTWKRRGVYAKSRSGSSGMILDFSIYDDETEEPDDVVFDLSDIHSEVYSSIKPYLNHKYIREFTLFAQWFERWMLPIGPSTAMDAGKDGIESVPTPYNPDPVIKMQCPVPREEISFMFRTFMNNEQVYQDNVAKLRKLNIEKIRQVAVDIQAKCTENKGTKWDFK